MDENGSYELTETSKDLDIRVSEDGPKPVVAAAVENQVRVRRLFSTAQLFMFSLTSMGLWEGMCTYEFSYLLIKQ